jgi:hypothetical protein
MRGITGICPNRSAGQAGGPFTKRQQLLQGKSRIAAGDNLGADVAWIDLADELPAAPARRQHVQRAICVTPHRHDPGDLVLASRNHGGDRGVLGAEAGSLSGVDAHTRITVACGCDQRASDFSEHSVAYLARVENGCGQGDQLIVQSIAHERTLPAWYGSVAVQQHARRVPDRNQPFECACRCGVRVAGFGAALLRVTGLPDAKRLIADYALLS